MKKDQAVALVRRAVREDGAGDYAAALQHYFAAHLSTRTTPGSAARLPFPGYFARAEEIPERRRQAGAAGGRCAPRSSSPALEVPLEDSYISHPPIRMKPTPPSSVMS